MQDIFWLFLKKLLSLDVDMFFLKKKMDGLDRWWVTGWVFLYHDTRTFAEGFKLLKTLQCIAIYWSTAHAVSLQRVAIAPCKGLRIPKSGKFLLVETVIKENFACRIRNHGLWNSEYSLRNPESHKKCGIWDAISSDIDWNPVSGIRNSGRGIQNPRLSWLSLHEAKTINVLVKLYIIIFVLARTRWYGIFILSILCT